MAQNRLLVRCLVCGVDIPIARLSAGDDVWTPARAEAAAGWETFLAAHTHDGVLSVALDTETEAGWTRSLSDDR